MWLAQINKREATEYFLGSAKGVARKIRSVNSPEFDSGSEIIFAWSTDPLEYFPPPDVAIVPNGEVQKFLVSLAASPQAPAPLTSLTRVLTHREFQQFLAQRTLFPTAGTVLPAFAAIALVESLHLSGMSLRQARLSQVRRTLSFCWGAAIAADMVAELEELPQRWIETSALLRREREISSLHRGVESMIAPLSTASQLAAGVPPPMPAGRLAYELVAGSKASQQKAWSELARRVLIDSAIDEIQAMTREERGAQLQKALRSIVPRPNGSHDEEAIAACAFLATRLAPGSLEHYESLRAISAPELLYWYALYAAIQAPREISSVNGGLGLRLLKEMSPAASISAPTADISFVELMIRGRPGAEALVRKFRADGGVAVELIPYVTCEFQSDLVHRGRPVADSRYDGEGMSRQSVRTRVSQLASELASIARELPETNDSYALYKSVRRKAD